MSIDGFLSSQQNFALGAARILLLFFAPPMVIHLTKLAGGALEIESISNRTVDFPEMMYASVAVVAKHALGLDYY